MFFVQRPASRFPQHTYRPDYCQQSSEERYYRELAEEHTRQADLALRLAQQERQRAFRDRELRAIRARQYQEQLARQSQFAPQHWNRRSSQFYNVPDSAPAFDLVLSFGNEPPRGYPTRPAHQTQPSEVRHYAGRQPTSFFEHLLQTLDASAEPERDTAAKRVRFGAEQTTSSSHPQPTRQDKGKGRAPVQENPTRVQNQDAPKGVNPAPSFWDFFGGLQALEEEDALVRQLNRFGEGSYPGFVQQGVAGPSGTKYTKPTVSSESPAPSTSASTPTAVPINIAGPSPSAPSSATSSPKSHTESFSSLDAIQSRFDALKSSFVFPTTPQFDSAAATSSGVPRLSYSPSNTSVHEYENELTKLLTRLDGVDSDGAESIRGARKALVVAVEKELDELDEQKKTAWRNSIVEVRVDTLATASDSNVAPESPSEPREDASEAESAWIPPVSAAASEEVRGYDVFEPTVEQPVQASTREETESAEALNTTIIHQTPFAPSDPTTQAEVADPASKDEVETPAPVMEASAKDLRFSAPEALEQVPAVQGQPTDSDSESEDETTDLTREQRHSESGAEPPVDVKRANPFVSEASLGGFVNTALAEETTNAPVKDVHASDDEFEIL